MQKLSTFSGEVAKVEVSFEQCCYELQTLRKAYSNSALSTVLGLMPLLTTLLKNPYHFWDF